MEVIGLSSSLNCHQHPKLHTVAFPHPFLQSHIIRLSPEESGTLPIQDLFCVLSMHALRVYTVSQLLRYV